MKIASLIAFFLLGSVAFADNAYTPKSGTPERKTILDAIRKPVQEEIGQPVIFKIDHFKVSGDWAFVKGQPLTAKGKQIDYSKTPLAEDAREADELLVAILQRKKGKWKVVEHAIFTTDVWWHGIHEDLGAPIGIFDFAP